MRLLLPVFSLCILFVTHSLDARAGVQTTMLSGRSAVQADTLFQSVQAGEPLIVQLPATFQGAPAQYELYDAPALSWLVDRSFYWRTLSSERGSLPILITRRVQGLPESILVLMVDILP